jgi:hypothetical protein
LFRTKKENQVDNINITFDNIEVIDLSKYKQIELNVNNDVLLGSVNNILYLKDYSCLVKSLKELYYFNNDGSFKNKIGARGNGPGEYNEIGSIFLKNDTICVFDSNKKKILYYTPDNTFLFEKNLSNLYNIENDCFPRAIFPIYDSKYLSANVFRGDHVSVLRYSLLGNDFELITNIEGKYLRDGSFIQEEVSLNHNNDIIAWILHTDTIYCVKKDSNIINPIYSITYENNNFAEIKEPTDNGYDLNMKWASCEGGSSGLMNSICENEEYIRFTFTRLNMQKDGFSTYLVKYNKKEKNAKLYELKYDNYNIFSSATYNNDDIIIVAHSKEEKNPLLIILNDKEL